MIVAIESINHLKPSRGYKRLMPTPRTHRAQRGLVGAILLAIGGVLGGRTDAREPGSLPSWIAPDESIVVLESPQFHFDWEHRRMPLKIDLFHCATQGVHTRYPSVRLVSEAEFIRQAFPDLEPGLAPVSPDSIKLLRDSETLRQRIVPLNVRYLVYGGTENDVETVHEDFGCIGAAAPAAVCIGRGEWRKRSSYNAIVIDLKQDRQSRNAGVAKGKSWLATLLPLFVVGWRSPTESHACDALGRDVLALLEGTVPPAPEAAEAR